MAAATEPGLPPRIKSVIKATGHLAHQRHMESVKGNVASSNNIVRHSAARQVDELGPAAAAAIEKILNVKVS